MKLNTKKLQLLTKEEIKKNEGGGWNFSIINWNKRPDYSKSGKVDRSYKHGTPWGKW